jgi:ribose/xylose/arabinose/galactoside ABC-type transport system permease subunit
MTLGMMVMGRGLALTLADGQPVGLGSRAADFMWLGRGAMLGLPVPVWIFAIVAGIAIYVLRYTPYGRQIYAVGSNAEAAHLSGINVGLVTFSVYVISGFLASLTAIIFVSRLTVGELAILANIMNLLGISPFTQQIVKGAIIIGAVLYEMLRKRRQRQ